MTAAGERLGRYQLLKNLIIFRGVAQLVARLVRDQEAMGSNPVTSTIVGDFVFLSQQKEDTAKVPSFLLLLLTRRLLVA